MLLLWSPDKRRARAQETVACAWQQFCSNLSPLLVGLQRDWQKHLPVCVLMFDTARCCVAAGGAAGGVAGAARRLRGGPAAAGVAAAGAHAAGGTAQPLQPAAAAAGAGPEQRGGGALPYAAAPRYGGPRHDTDVAQEVRRLPERGKKQYGTPGNHQEYMGTAWRPLQGLQLTGWTSVSSERSAPSV